MKVSLGSSIIAFALILSVSHTACKEANSTPETEKFEDQFKSLRKAAEKLNEKLSELQTSVKTDLKKNEAEQLNISASDFQLIEKYKDPLKSLRKAAEKLNEKVSDLETTLATDIKEVQLNISSSDLKPLGKQCTADVDQIVELALRLNESLANLEARLTSKIEAALANQTQRPMKCNPCTEVLATVGKDHPACLPKYHMIYESKDDCTCACGKGTQTLEMKCVTYEDKGKNCVQKETFPQNCPDGLAMNKTEDCNKGPCTVTKIVEKTRSDTNSESDDTMKYTAFTKNGQSCRLGTVKKANNVQRRNNAKDEYGPSEIQNSECDDICLAPGETFDRIEVKISGEDGWLTNYIEVTVNEASSIYTNGDLLDDKLTGVWEKS